MSILKSFGRMTAAAGLLSLALLPQAAKAQTLEGAGATFPYPVYKVWFANFQKATNMGVNYQAVGSGAGIAALKAKTVDFGASDAPLSAAEEAAMGGPVVHIPTVGGAVVLTYNLPGIGSGVRFTPEIIAGIFRGEIKSWDDPKMKAANRNINLPNTAIQPVHRTDGSGTTYIFTNYLKKVDGGWASSIGAGKSVNWPVGLGGKGNQGVEAVVSRTPGGIGYVELQYAIQGHLPFGSIRNHAGNFVAPSSESTTEAINKQIGTLKGNIKAVISDPPGNNSYPIVGLTYILLYKNGGRNTGGATKLWSWAMEAAQQGVAHEQNYAPLPEALIGINMAALKSIRGAQVSSR